MKPSTDEEGADSPTAVVDRESGPGASVSTEKIAPRVSKRKWMDWSSMAITWGSSGVIRTGACVGDPWAPSVRHESPTPGAQASEGSLFSFQCGPLQDGAGWLRCLRANQLRCPRFHSSNKSIPFPWGPCGHFSLRLFLGSCNSHC